MKQKLVDLLESKVDDKYFLSKKMTDFYIFNSKKQEEKGNGFRFDPVSSNDKAAIAHTITCRSGSRMDDNYVIDEKHRNERLKLTLEKNVLEDGDFIDTYNKAVKKDGNSGTITTRVSASNNMFVAVDVTSALRIRKLTPRECFRLMGVKDQDFDNIKNEFNDSVLYHLAGDSIVVNVLMAIIGKLL